MLFDHNIFALFYGVLLILRSFRLRSSFFLIFSTSPNLFRQCFRFTAFLRLYSSVTQSQILAVMSSYTSPSTPSLIHITLYTDYATFSVKTLYPSIDIGTFSLSTNRCQSLKATFKYTNTFIDWGFNLPFDGSLKLECDQRRNKFKLAVSIYDDPLCNDLTNGDSSKPLFIDLQDNVFTIYDSIQFSLDEMSCNPSSASSSCGISMEMANNCSWSDSERYLNISSPDNKCISLQADFNGILSIIPYQILPHEFANELETSSMRFSCCPGDKSLVVSNYTDATCATEPDAQFRIPADYNGQCMVVGDNDRMVEDGRGHRGSKLDENADGTYVFMMKWECGEYVDSCDGIQVISDELMPTKCTDVCIEIEEQQERESNQGKEIEDDDEDDEGDVDGTTKGVGVTVAVIVAIALLFVFIVVFAVVYGRKKAMQRVNESNMAVAMDKNVGGKKKGKMSGDKYEAFVDGQEQEQDFNMVHVEDVNEMPDNTVQ